MSKHEFLTPDEIMEVVNLIGLATPAEESGHSQACRCPDCVAAWARGGKCADARAELPAKATRVLVDLAAMAGERDGALEMLDRAIALGEKARVGLVAAVEQFEAAQALALQFQAMLMPVQHAAIVWGAAHAHHEAQPSDAAAEILQSATADLHTAARATISAPTGIEATMRAMIHQYNEAATTAGLAVHNQQSASLERAVHWLRSVLRIHVLRGDGHDDPVGNLRLLGAVGRACADDLAARLAGPGWRPVPELPIEKYG